MHIYLYPESILGEITILSTCVNFHPQAVFNMKFDLNYNGLFNEKIGDNIFIPLVHGAINYYYFNIYYIISSLVRG